MNPMENKSEKLIKLTAKLYDCRDTARAFFKEKYKEKLKPYTHILKQVMKANNLEEIPALLKISETEHYQENGMAQMMYMAAVVELIEPTCTHPWETTETTFGGGVRCTKCNTILN
jgi:phage I-like protein